MKWTIQKILDWTKGYFESWNVDNPMLDAQCLLQHVLGITKVQMMIDSARPLEDEELARYKALITRRAKERIPVAYLLGKREFWSMMFRVTPDVLIPRPDTECVVERALEFALERLEGRMPRWLLEQPRKIVYDFVRDSRFHDEDAQNDEITGTPAEIGRSEPAKTLTILDVGTGSGAIALALASEIPVSSRTIVAIDISPAALALARENAQSNGLMENMTFLESDVLDNYKATADLIVSNPPYISQEEMKTLMPEVRCEPRLAREAGMDGLDVYRKLIPQSYKALVEGGMLIVEIGCTQAEQVSALFAESGFERIRAFEDYAHKPRMVLGIKTR